MSEKRRALGRGLGALIPSGPATDRPIDVFFRDQAPVTPPAPTQGDDSGRSVSESEPDPSDLPAIDGPATTDVGAPASETEAPASDDAAAVVDSDTGLRPVPGAEFAEIPLDQIRPNPRQPRTVFDEDELAELVHSIREIGVLQPVVVRRIPTEAQDGEARFELIMGERRWRASREAGKDVVPAIIKVTEEDDLLRDALLENLHRSQLNALEEAAAYQQLLDDFGCTQEELARRIGRSRPQISNTLRLLKLPPLVQRRVAAGVLSAGHARALLGMSDSAAMERMAQRIVAEGFSVRTVEELVTLGDDDTAPVARRAPRAGARRPQLDDLAADLSDRLETRVRIALGQRKGRLTVEFASVDDLNRILDAMHLRHPRD